MMLKENLYKNALSIIEEIYVKSKYDPDVDLYRSCDIMNAINDALSSMNKEVTSQPITPEKILKAIGKI